MNTPASLRMKALYCATLLSFFVSCVFGSGGWIGMVFGGGLLPGGPLIWLPFILWRIYVVFRRPDALSASANPSRTATICRNFGIFLMLIGLVASVAIFMRRQLTMLLVRDAGDDGIVFFVVGVGLYMLSNAGILGVAVFEISRKKSKQSKTNVITLPDDKS